VSSFEVWVVDNASTDHSAEMVELKYPDVKLIVNPSNTGFSRANNQIIEQSKSRFVFLLNSDAWVSMPGALDRLVEFADAHPKAAVVGTRVLNPDSSLQYSCRRFPSLGAGLFRNTYLGRLFPHNRYAQEYLMGDFDHSVASRVDWVSGCAMLLRRDFLDQEGGLDERFFMYCEDVDICKRAWVKGWEVWYAPDPVVYHRIGASSDNKAEAMIWEFHRSWELFDEKHHPNSPIIRRWAVKSGLWLRATVRCYHRRRALRRLHSSVSAALPASTIDDHG
jgi:GT2 family glycosyltransferase